MGNTSKLLIFIRQIIYGHKQTPQNIYLKGYVPIMNDVRECKKQFIKKRV